MNGRKGDWVTGGGGEDEVITYSPLLLFSHSPILFWKVPEPIIFSNELKIILPCNCHLLICLYLRLTNV